jgi:hypothetical protein
MNASKASHKRPVLSLKRPIDGSQPNSPSICPSILGGVPKKRHLIYVPKIALPQVFGTAV